MPRRLHRERNDCTPARRRLRKGSPDSKCLSHHPLHKELQYPSAFRLVSERQYRRLASLQTNCGNVNDHASRTDAESARSAGLWCFAGLAKRPKRSVDAPVSQHTNGHPFGKERETASAPNFVWKHDNHPNTSDEFHAEKAVMHRICSSVSGS